MSTEQLHSAGSGRLGAVRFTGFRTAPCPKPANCSLISFDIGGGRDG
jgi:hypothetical protein